VIGAFPSWAGISRRRPHTEHIRPRAIVDGICFWLGRGGPCEAGLRGGLSSGHGDLNLQREAGREASG